MTLKTQTIKELKQIVEKDYGVLLSDDEAKKLGSSLLKLTRMSLAALARADEKNTLALSGNSVLHS